MSEAEITELRSRIEKLEEQGDEFARRSNILLDEILITDENLKTLTERVDRLASSQENTQATVAQLATLMVQLAQNAEIDRTEIRRIWEYLRSERPNGRG